MVTKTQLAAMYGISRPTLNKKLTEIGLYVKGRSLFTPKELVLVFKRLGYPKSKLS